MIDINHNIMNATRKSANLVATDNSESTSMAVLALHPPAAPLPKRGFRKRTLGLLGVVGLAAAICGTSAPDAYAVSFTDGDTATNPFFYDGTTSSWTASDGIPEGGNEVDAGVFYDADTNSVIIQSSGIPGADTWTSSSADQDYTISFSFNFDNYDSTAFGFYQISGSNAIALTSSGDFFNLALLGGQSLTFGVENEDGFGDLAISNFSATPVPAPLPLLGAGAAFGWIRRRRAQLRGRLLPAAVHQ
jgi:MYXO-CTERM domain-containing protein